MTQRRNWRQRAAATGALSCCVHGSCNGPRKIIRAKDKQRWRENREAVWLLTSHVLTEIKKPEVFKSTATQRGDCYCSIAGGPCVTLHSLPCIRPSQWHCLRVGCMNHETTDQFDSDFDVDTSTYWPPWVTTLNSWDGRTVRGAWWPIHSWSIHFQFWNVLHIFFLSRLLHNLIQCRLIWIILSDEDGISGCLL